MTDVTGVCVRDDVTSVLWVILRVCLGEMMSRLCVSGMILRVFIWDDVTGVCEG